MKAKDLERHVLRYILMVGIDCLIDRHFPKTSEAPTSTETPDAPEPPSKTSKKPRAGKTKMQSAKYLAAKQLLEDHNPESPN